MFVILVDVMIMIVVLAAVMAIGAYCLFDRWCNYNVERLRIEAHREEIRFCYDSEQSFLDIMDDEEHLESITPTMTSRLPSLTDEERAEAERELADDIA